MKNRKWLSLLVAAMMAFGSLGFVACSDGGDDGDGKSSTYALVSFSATQSTTTSNAVALTWVDSKEVYKYYIYYNTQDDSSSATKYSSNGYASDEYDSSNKKTGNFKGTKDVSLSKTGTYYFWIKAVDRENNESAFSSVASCSFVYSSLSAPTDISAAQSETSYNNVKVTWRDSSNASKYYIYYSKTNDSSSATKYSSNGYATDEYDSSYKKTGYYAGSKEIALSETGTYYFWVKAVDGTNNESDFSDSANASFTYSALNAPIDVTATASTSGTNTVTVTWRDSKEANKYFIYYGTTNDSSSATKYSLNGYASDEYDSSYKKTGYYKGTKDITLTTTGTYYFWVKGVDGTNHESDFSTIATYTYN